MGKAVVLASAALNYVTYSVDFVENAAATHNILITGTWEQDIAAIEKALPEGISKTKKSDETYE